jgi:hypothetical protein
MAVMPVAALQVPPGNQPAGPNSKLLIKGVARKPLFNLEPRQPSPRWNFPGGHRKKSFAP